MSVKWLSEIFSELQSGATGAPFNSRILLVILAAAISVAGCTGLISHTGASREYGITTNDHTYQRGGNGEAIIWNTSSKPLEYNLCPRRLEREVDTYWVTTRVWPTDGAACPSGTRTLAKGDSVRTIFEIPVGVSPARYRVVFTGLLGKGLTKIETDRVATPVFEVR
jgi:uncharacterized protein YceK